MKFLLSIHYLIWLVISALLTAAGEFLSKKFALAPKCSYVFLIIFVYSLGALAWLPAIMQKNSLSVAGTIWSVLTLATTILIGILIFGEKISAIGIAGIFTAIVAVVLLSLS